MIRCVMDINTDPDFNRTRDPYMGLENTMALGDRAGRHISLFLTTSAPPIQPLYTVPEQLTLLPWSPISHRMLSHLSGTDSFSRRPGCPQHIHATRRRGRGISFLTFLNFQLLEFYPMSQFFTLRPFWSFVKAVLSNIGIKNAR